jgi:hypothetical protein
MNNLFSSIQQNLQQNNQNSLLQNQKINQDKINELLETSAEAMMCGPACQKSKITDELQQKYLDAQTNVQTAPITLEKAKKNYFIYSEGRPYYENMLEEELTQKSEKIAEVLEVNFNEEVSSALTMNSYFNTALINSNYTEELLDSYIEKNKEFELLLRNRKGDILTNDRKTYYEVDALNNLKGWYNLWWRIYYILVIVMSLALLFTPSKIDSVNGGITQYIKKIILLVVVIFYPYYVDYIVLFIKSVYMKIYNILPKNVYNNL